MRTLALETRSTTTYALALALALASGCSEHQDRGNSAVNGAYEQLAVQLQNCANDALNCLGAANCDDAAEQACRDGYRACRAETRAAYRAFHAAVRECFATKWECVSDAGWGDAGRTERQACREQFHMCVADERPIRAPAGPCLQGLRECVHADAMSGERPGREQVRDCLSAAHQCVVDRLPMCEPDEPGEAGAGGASAGSGGSGAAGAAGAGTAGSGGAGP